MSSSTVGASGKDTSAFVSDISRLNTSDSNNSPESPSNSTMDEIPDHTAKRIAVLARNNERDGKRIAGIVNFCEDEVLSDEDPNCDEEEVFGADDEFAKLQNLSPNDFKVAMNFSINHAAEAGFAAARSSIPR